jgi:acetate kinase
MRPPILCLNAGSSSLKFAVYRFSDAGRETEEERLFSGAVEEVGAAEGRLWLRGAAGSLPDRKAPFAGHAEAAEAMFSALAEQGSDHFLAAGHRVVHGGPLFYSPQRVDSHVLAQLKKLVPFAPLHLPCQIAIAEELSRRVPNLPQVVCFDTAFHRELPEVAKRFALPRRFWDEGVIRYGFHGLSYEFVSAKLGKELGSRAIIAHLGNGASMVALRDGKPVDTSMGLTPTGGFMMGTRTGDLDPGVILYLLRQGWNGEQLEALLDRESGLAGVSGLTSDMKMLLEQGGREPRAAQAVEMFCYQVRKFIGGFAAALNGLDTLVFTGGIGERAAPVRAEVCRGLDHLGVRLNAEKNAQHAGVISDANSACRVCVVPTDEDLMIARHTRRVVDQVTSSSSK